MKLILIVLTVLLAASSLSAGGSIDTRAEAREYVRKLTNLIGTNLISDTTLNDILDEAIYWTSVDIGGVEAQFRIVTVAEQAWYDMPDTVVEVLASELVTEDRATHPFKSLYPQWMEELGIISKLEALEAGETSDDYPSGFHYWADTVQLYPTPVRVDTVILKCYVEHPADSTYAFTYNIYVRAAMFLAASEILTIIEKDAKAATYMEKYNKMKVDLRAKYVRKFDVRGSGE